MSQPKFYDNEETLPNGIKVKRKCIWFDLEYDDMPPEGEEFWIANIAIRDFSPDTDPRYCFIQANGKTRDEAISNLHKMVWEELTNSLTQIAEKRKEIDVLESRRVKLATWLDGGTVEVLK